MSTGSGRGKVMAVRPLIGITTSEVRPLTYANPTPEAEPFRAEMALGMTYANAIERAGGAPVVLPPLPLEVVGSLVARLDGICFSGGPDIDPVEYGAEVDPQLGPTWRRLDRFELEVARQANGASGFRPRNLPWRAGAQRRARR